MASRRRVTTCAELMLVAAWIPAVVVAPQSPPAPSAPSRESEIALGAGLGGVGLVAVIGIVWWASKSGVFGASKATKAAESAVDFAAPWIMKRADKPIVFVPMKETDGWRSSSRDGIMRL